VVAVRRRLTRSPERTRERILAAALEEFSSRGFSGARVDAIARRGRINKRMLYHYFGSKQGLFQAVLARKMMEKAPLALSGAGDLSSDLPFLFGLANGDPSWIRLMQWEALERRTPIVLARQRRGFIESRIATLRERQTAGFIASDLDAELLLIMMFSLAASPVAFPQLALLVSGAPSGSAAFGRRWSSFLVAVARHLRGSAREVRHRRTAGASASRGAS
jgi:AcrR family transcriptional regulator